MDLHKRGLFVRREENKIIVVVQRKIDEDEKAKRASLSIHEGYLVIVVDSVAL